MKKATFTTPDPQQYVELLGDDNFVSAPSPDEYTGRIFDRIRIHAAGIVIEWRVDAVAPTRIGQPPDLFASVSTAQAQFQKTSMVLSQPYDKLELRFHVASPFSALQHGIWASLQIRFLAGKLELVKGNCFSRVAGDTRIRSASPAWIGDNKHPADPSARWVVDDARQPGRGNPLLSVSAAEPGGRANLIDLDPQRGAAHAGDYALAFVLDLRDGVFDVTTEFVLSPTFAYEVPISGYALGTDFGSRRRTPLKASGARLLSRLNPDRLGWSLRWRDVMGSSETLPAGALSLESYTQELLDAHAFGLATVRSRSRLSFVPTSVRTTDAGAQVELQFELASSIDQLLTDCRLARVPVGDASRRLQLVFGGATDTLGAPLRFDAQASDASDSQGQPVIDWVLEGAGEPQPRTALGLSSVLLSFSGFSSGRMTFRMGRDGQDYGRAPLASSVDLSFTEASFSGLSVDPEQGFETLERFVSRPRPWVVDLGGSQSCTLAIHESADSAQSRLLHLELFASAAGDLVTDTVVVDTSPMTIARVQATEAVLGGSLLAEYVDDADQAPEWTFQSEKGRFSATLPPQGHGEEMIKGTLHIDDAGRRVRVPRDGALFDFRLTPVAQLMLDRTDVDTARSEPPWSLRRLLGRRTGAIGMKLLSADFELLYGMTARVEANDLRVAELEAFVGHVPLADELRTLMRRRLKSGLPRSTRVAMAGAQADHDARCIEHALSVAQWMNGLWARPSWWRVYRDVENRGQVVIDEGVTFQLRPSRATAHPFDISRPASLGAPGGDKRPPLRGGVDWPFQTLEEYAAIVDRPKSVAGSIQGLVFGTLGGEGTQSATFDNGKTLIITSSRQGRLDSLSLIRVGRIGMLWNHARHVIVYERTTRVAPRYAPSPVDDQDTFELQPPLAGVAALRKVREYIEITEPRRRYPDSSASQAAAGPLVQSAFGSVVIPVRSDWGRSVRDGLAIALRGPVPAGLDHLFPDPHVFLDLARAPGKGEGAVSHRIRSTARLLFFTSTRSEDTGDTDTWPARPGIDFPLLAPAGPPNLPFTSSFANSRRQPDAASADLGMAPFTLDLDPAEEAVNLMHGRNVPGLEARVSNVNLSRGRLPAADPTQPRKNVEGYASAFGQMQSQVVDGLAELNAALSQATRRGLDASSAGQAQLRQDAKALMDRLRATAAAVPPLPQQGDMPPAHGWTALQSTLADNYQAATTADAKRLGGQLRAQAGKLLVGTGDVRARAAAIVDVVHQQAVDSAGRLTLVAGQGLAAVGHLLDGLAARFGLALGALANDLVADVGRLEQSYMNGEAPAMVESRWEEAYEAVPGELRHLLDAIEREMNGSLGEWFSRLQDAHQDTMYDQLRADIATELANALDWLDRWNDSLPPFDLAPPDFAGMRTTIERCIAGMGAALVAAARARLAGFSAELASWENDLGQAGAFVDGWANDIQDALPGLDPAHIPGLLNDAAAALEQQMDAAASMLAGAAQQLASHVTFASLQGAADVLQRAGTDIGVALDTIARAVDGDLAQLERIAREQARQVEELVQGGARQIDQWAKEAIEPYIDLAKQDAEAGLSMLRALAEGPVTDLIAVSRDQLGYYYREAVDALDLTRASAFFNDLGAEVLSPLSICMPFDRIRDRLLPQLKGFAIRDLLPDFGGLKLTDLLPDLDVPSLDLDEYSWLKVEHGFDKDRLRAWAKVDIDKQFDAGTPATLFDLGPIKLSLRSPRFTAHSELSVAQDGTRAQQTRASLAADFQLSLSDEPMVTLHDAVLSFDERGELKFDFDARQMELSPQLQFISDALRLLKPDVDGATISPLLPTGVSASVCLPLPDIGTGAFTLTGITLNTHLDLMMASGFEIATGMWLSKPDRPFGLAILFLGGGGWFGIDVRYRPPASFSTRVSIGISAGAFLAVNFGFAQGSAGLLFTAGVDFQRDSRSGSGSTALTVGLLVWGEFSVLGIASAGMRITLGITYDGGSLVGKGTFSVSIRICWCFTLHVSRVATKTFAGPGQSSQHAALMQRQTAHAELAQPMRTAHVSGLSPQFAEIDDAIDFEHAISAFYETLAVARSNP